jgi:hypothetical protein
VKIKKNFITYLLFCFIGLSVFIVSYVLFQYPEPGVADQGDFDRIMSISGLELTEQNKQDPKFDRFFNYLVTDYKIPKEGVLEAASIRVRSSLAYIIILINFICKMLRQNIFKTSYLSITYAITYIFSLYMIIKYINIRSKVLLLLLSSVSLFIFLDGNYLVWFNSLYGEPMMITTLLLYISSWIYYINYKYVFKSKKKILPKIIFIFITSFLFLGSKMQVITSLPIIVVMLAKLLWENRYEIKGSQLCSLFIVICLITAYPLSINFSNGQINKDIQYNSVFYGILKDSKNPSEDLIAMNLNNDMASEAGKHSYLNKNEYIKYAPHSRITEKEFYSKMSNSKLVNFYITHPIRLIQGMEYTANHAFFTGTNLGHYQRSYSEVPIREFNRFTLWSTFRESILPKQLSFVMLIYTMVFGFSLFTYVKSKKFQEVRAKIELLWSVIFIGLFQFPMPFIGNGQADTSKQLYLFNFIFDMMLIVLICWGFYKLTKLINLKNFKRY